MGARKSRMMLGFVVLGLLMFVILSSASESFKSFSVATGGYVSAFEGPKARFYGVSWNPNGVADRFYSSSRGSGNSMGQFDSILRFDGDAEKSGYPNIIGEESSVFIPKQSLDPLPSFVPFPWLNSQNYIMNPGPTYNWTIGEKTYYMEQWTLRYYVSFSAEGSGGAGLFAGTGEYPPQNQYVNGENSYQNLKVWVEFDTEPTWYIQGQGTAYFAIAKVQKIDAPIYKAKDTSGNSLNPRSSVSVSPESPGVPMWLSYEPFGGVSQTRDPFFYQGKELNAAYFTNKTFMSIAFNRFGLYGDWNTPGNILSGVWCRGDVATLGFDVTVFVIGQWNVKDIQDNPDDFGRFVKTDSSTLGILSWLTAPSTLAWLIPALIIAAIFIFAPWLIVALIALFRG